jgi:DNA-directed RNA polymerase specialized sigma24 family protein
MSGKIEFVLSQEAFDRFLARLDSDRERAGEKYEALRRKLIMFFRYRGCPDDERLTDETIDRVVRKTGEEHIDKLVPYTLAVARRVASEAWRRENVPPPTPPASPEPLGWERQLEFLSVCMQLLPERQRTLILDYYQHDKSQKIEDKRRLASALGIASTALRVRVFRIRRQLEQCVKKKLREAGQSRNGFEDRSLEN